MYLPEPNGKEFTPPPAGTHAAICYRFIDLGTQLVEWKGTKKTQRKVLIGWELPTELMEDGKPFTVSRRYTWSMSDKSNLRHDLEAWRGKSFTQDDFAGPNRFNIRNILGKACLLSIVHETKDDKTYANLKGVSSLPKGMAAPEPISEQVYFALEKPLFDAAILATLSDKLQETIKGSPEYKELTHPSEHVEGDPRGDGQRTYELDDDITF